MKERAKTFDSQRGEKKEKRTTLAEAPILMINKKEACTRSSTSKSPTFEGREITFPLVTKGINSSEQVIIKARIFRREVGQVHMDTGSSCEVIYEHCFLKLKPFIQASKVDSQVPLVGFLGEKKDNNTEDGDGEGVKKIKETSPANTEGVLSCSDAEEQIVVNSNHIKPIKQKRQSLGPDRSTSARKEVEELTRAGILREAAHQTWVANPVMVKKSDGGWRIASWTLTKATTRSKWQKKTKTRQHSSQEKESTATERCPSVIKNTGAKYQRLVDKVFNEQIGRNLEAYVDDMVIKSTSEEDMLTDIKETFQRFRSINMKLKKCSFGVKEGPFLGHLITKQGI
ncbi:hypothetical protein Tco_0653909 [Tanacetum coccineum]|uniref:Reverse transcriptase domain-containing protein n=1 Tax=Tanacetum coccineum TaxID=301880 RepID=A0ABQ4X2H4_9ASTR